MGVFFYPLQQLQAMEERRIKKLGELFEEYSDVECKVMPIVQTCLNNIKTNGSSVDGTKASKKLVLCYKHGLQVIFVPDVVPHPKL